jgi:hypothetical protein
MPLLVKYSGDWADEFQCEEFCIMPDGEAYDAWIAVVKSNIDNGQTEFYFGTNEFQTFRHIDDLIRDVEVSEITDEEAAVFNKYFRGSFGTSGVFSIDAYE